MNLMQIYHVARREYVARVKNKAFVFTTLLVPLLMIIYVVLIPALFSKSGTKELKLAVLDNGTGYGAELVQNLAGGSEPEFIVSRAVLVPDTSESTREPFNRAVLASEIDGYIVLSKDPEIPFRGSYYARETGNPLVLSRIRGGVQTTALGAVLEGSGVDVEKVRRVQWSGLQTVTVSSEGESEGGFEAAFFSTLVFGMLLYMAVLINGQGMAMVIVEEKSSRLIEVILGAVTAIEFMAGKVIGVLLSGMTQLGIWVGCSMVAVLYALPALSMMPGDAPFDLGAILNVRVVFFFCVFFTLGYLLYSTIFAALAATCSSTEELGQAMFPAMFPFILAFFATFYAVPNPSTTLTRVLSLLPPFTPLVMLARVNVLMPPLWEVWLSIGLLIVAVVCSFWLAGKIFRFALLMYGKRPTIPEIVKMLRAS